ncbi:hypothetical protein BE04_41870 [Sorangium cellulosum]|jgi:hypothetical protein|uniref:Uncharacterized protein n=2 Tax=Sorangium cellulosum TaxID=56 RepID=A0A150TWX6_SORCE|nr:hypothetical protein [Sorangium cellulosum]AGP41409.1 hypothetical protein SCE1572_47145 [Sorangium cellulosum So0157-2]KYF62067.1 hypothetical protein BE04_41870 [Sorangium cellulosum]KYG09192.1 hypothetical protein BE21_19280 [Sorangium cellulosum]
MSGPPVTIGCAVVLSPGAAGPPDSGMITTIPHGIVTASGMPLAVVGSLCQMVNSVSGAPYPLSIGSLGASTLVTIQDQALVRVGDRIPSGSGILTVIGPPAAPFVTDGGAP